MRRLLFFSLIAVAVWAPGSGAAWSQGTRPLQDAERGRAQAQAQAHEAASRARAAAAEEQRLAELRVAAAARLRATETEVADRAAEVSALTAQRDEAGQRLAQHGAALAPLLPLMERLALFPAETLLAVPAPPEQALLGLSVLRGMARRLEREASGLRDERAALDAQTRALNLALPRLQAAQAAQAEQSAALDQQIAAAHAKRQQAEDAGAEAQRRAAAEAARADGIRAALAALEAARARAEAQARDDAARADRLRQEEVAGQARRRQEALARPAGPGPLPQGLLVAPVAGSVVRGWGDATDAGPSTGMSYRPAPLARVVAPCGGRVRFAGPFRSYGVLVILDCGGGYAFVLAGLERLDVAVGATVLAGEPVGSMPGYEAAGAGPRPALYVELRRDGQAVNPAPFLRARG
jgi:septal ring factor EnvC (AmiA/AmiB activator)